MKYLEYNEKKQHGTAAFPIQYYYVDKAHPEYIMPLHWHKEFEIVHIISGTLSVYIDNIEFNMQSGDIALIECSVLHRGEPTDCIYECIVFDANMLRKHHNDVIGQYILPILNHTVSLKSFIIKKDFPEVSKTVLNLSELLISREKFYELRVFGLLFQLFDLIYRNGLIVETVQNKHYGKQIKKLMELMDWIEANYTEQITLAKLSEVSEMNEKYLCKFFKEFTARTPIDYINNLKIQCACHELTVNHLSITDAAFESGFNNLSYFSKTFKKYVGVSPKEFKSTVTGDTDGK